MADYDYLCLKCERAVATPRHEGCGYVAVNVREVCAIINTPPDVNPPPTVCAYYHERSKRTCNRPLGSYEHEPGCTWPGAHEFVGIAVPGPHASCCNCGSNDLQVTNIYADVWQKIRCVDCGHDLGVAFDCNGKLILANATASLNTNEAR